MASIQLDTSTWPEFENRIRAIREDTQRQWGAMSSARMLRHLQYTFQVSMGEAEERDRSIPVLRTLMYWGFFHIFTHWPKGKIKAPASFFPEPDGTFEEVKAKVLESGGRFLERLRKNPDHKALNPFLGRIPLSRWSHVHGAHCDHHLRQFNV